MSALYAYVVVWVFGSAYVCFWIVEKLVGNRVSPETELQGLDVPEIETVLMLRPTESPVVFLQQLGRGLRTTDGKEVLTIIDFIGNHRSFLLKPRTLLSLGARTVPSTARVLDAMRTGEFDLPPGCAVSYDLTLVDMFRSLVCKCPRS